MAQFCNGKLKLYLIILTGIVVFGCCIKEVKCKTVRHVTGNIEEFIPWAFYNTRPHKRDSTSDKTQSIGLPKSLAGSERIGKQSHLPPEEPHQNPPQSGADIRQSEGNGMTLGMRKQHGRVGRRGHHGLNVKHSNDPASGKDLGDTEDRRWHAAGIKLGEELSGQLDVWINESRWTLWDVAGDVKRAGKLKSVEALARKVDKYGLPGLCVPDLARKPLKSTGKENRHDNADDTQQMGMAMMSKKIFLCWKNTSDANSPGNLTRHGRKPRLYSGQPRDNSVKQTNINSPGPRSLRDSVNLNLLQPNLGQGNKLLKIRVTPSAKLDAAVPDGKTVVLELMENHIYPTANEGKIKADDLEIFEERNVIESTCWKAEEDRDMTTPFEELVGLVIEAKEDVCLQNVISREKEKASQPFNQGFIVLDPHAVCRVYFDWQRCNSGASIDTNIDSKPDTTQGDHNKMRNQINTDSSLANIDTVDEANSDGLQGDPSTARNATTKKPASPYKNMMSRIEHVPPMGFEWESNMIFF